MCTLESFIPTSNQAHVLHVVVAIFVIDLQKLLVCNGEHNDLGFFLVRFRPLLARPSLRGHVWSVACGHVYQTCNKRREAGDPTGQSKPVVRGVVMRRSAHGADRHEA